MNILPQTTFWPIPILSSLPAGNDCKRPSTRRVGPDHCGVEDIAWIRMKMRALAGSTAHLLHRIQRVLSTRPERASIRYHPRDLAHPWWRAYPVTLPLWRKNIPAAQAIFLRRRLFRFRSGSPVLPLDRAQIHGRQRSNVRDGKILIATDLLRRE